MDFLSVITTFIATALLLLFLAFSNLILKIFIGKSIRNPEYPPVAGTVLSELFHFNRLYDFQTQIAKTRPTFRILAPDQSDIYTTDSRNIEHILKTKFDKYTKGKENQDVAGDLFGQGIFVVDGEKWRRQRKLASFEFSARVLRDFSCAVFRKNAANLVTTVSEFSAANRVFDIQVSNLKPKSERIIWVDLMFMI